MIVTQWRDIYEDPPEEGQYVSLKCIVEMEAWYVPSKKFNTWVKKAMSGDTQCLPIKWRPIEGAKSYYDEFD